MLVRQSHPGVVSKNLDGFLKATGEVKAVPRRKIVDKVIDTGNAVFNQHTVHLDKRVKVYTSTPVLNARDKSGAQRGNAGVMVAVLLHVDGVPVLGMGDTKDEVEHLGSSPLRLYQGLGRVGV